MSDYKVGQHVTVKLSGGRLVTAVSCMAKSSGGTPIFTTQVGDFKCSGCLAPSERSKLNCFYDAHPKLHAWFRATDAKVLAPIF